MFTIKLIPLTNHHDQTDSSKNIFDSSQPPERLVFDELANNAFQGGGAASSQFLAVATRTVGSDHQHIRGWLMCFLPSAFCADLRKGFDWNRHLVFHLNDE